MKCTTVNLPKKKEAVKTALSKIEKKASIIHKFYYIRTMSKMLERNFTSVLDAGCGMGSPFYRKIRSKIKETYVVGLDVFRPYLKRCKDGHLFDDLICADVRHMPFQEKPFDVVLCLEVVEHLEKKQGYRLLTILERLARKQVIISTLVGIMPHGIKEGNVWEIHKSGWHPKEFRKRKYEIRGVSGPFFFAGKEIKSQRFKYLASLAGLLTYLMQPLYYFIPEIAFQMICVKNLEPN